MASEEMKMASTSDNTAAKPEESELKMFKEDITRKIDGVKKQKDKTLVIPRAQMIPIPRQDAIISLGPYRPRKPKPMDKHKYVYVDHILGRNSNSEIEKYYKKLKKLEEQVRDSYEEISDSVNLMEMMMLDGCFIVEYFLRIHEKKTDELTSQKIEFEMLSLRNQLPFSVLQGIFELLDISSSLSEIIGKHFVRSSFYQRTALDAGKLPVTYPAAPDVHHLVHLFHSVLISAWQAEMESTDSASSKPYSKSKSTTPARNTSNSFDGENDFTTIPSAKELQNAGIDFKKGSGFLVVKFNKGFILRRGTIEIPPLKIDAFTKSLIMDLVHFEKLHPQKLDPNLPKKPQFTSHVKFFDNIINTSADVALLRNRGIIDHSLGSDSEVAVLFNAIGGSNFRRDLPDYLRSVYEDVNKYYKARRHHWWASLARSHFNSPWSFLKLVAAVILLLLASTQTFYAVYSNYRPPHP